MKFSLYKQLPKPSKRGIEGYIHSDSKKADLYPDKDKPLRTEKLIKPELVSISMNGITLKGFESDGFDKTGREKFKYQEWWLVYCEDGITKSS